MKFFLDTANLDELKKGASWGIVDGVTTNPSLIAKEGRPIEEQVRMICDIVDGDISAEVVSTESDGDDCGRAQAGQDPQEHRGEVPVDAGRHQGDFGAQQRGHPGQRDALFFGAAQALLAAKAGAYIISPFVGRLDDIGAVGMDLIRSITQIYKNYGYKTQVLAASLRGPTHVIDSALAGRAHRHHAVQGAGHAVQSPADRQGAGTVPEGLQ